MRFALLIYGAINAILYAGLTPLWEGFDEPFHFACVQHIWHTRSLPVLHRTCLSEEVWRSIPLAPASYIVQRNLPMVTTFDDYFRLPEAERLARRDSLRRLDPGLADVASKCPNYQAQQAPLAYVLLAPFHGLWSGAPLPARVWRLRLACALVASLATGLLLFRLARLLALDDRWANAAVFLVFSSQMFYATTAHVANDWLAVPLFLLVLERAIAVYRDRRRGAVLMLALALSAGLLTKAYFLTMAPFALGVVLACCGWRERVLFVAVPLATAAPWYIRNLRLYGDLAGQQESFGGTRVGALFHAVFQVPWWKTAAATAKATLWQGNNSATTFGSTTIWLMIALLLAAAVCYAASGFRRPATHAPGAARHAEWVLLAGLCCYAAGLVYDHLVQYLVTSGAAVAVAPWHVELLAPPGICLLLAGLARSGRLGAVLRAAMCWLWAYVIASTYIAKLIPMYGGYGGRPARLLEMARWYGGSWAKIQDMLATTAMISPWAIFVLTAAVAVGALALAWICGARGSSDYPAARP